MFELSPAWVAFRPNRPQLPGQRTRCHRFLSGCALASSLGRNADLVGHRVGGGEDHGLKRNRIGAS